MNPWLLILMVSCAIAFSARMLAAAEASPPAGPPVIILKLDDLTVRTANAPVPAQWKRLADYIERNQLKAGFGVIANSLEQDNAAYVNWIKERQARGAIEFWFHGYDHAAHTEDGTVYNEFTGRTAEEQLDRFVRSQRLARDKLGFAFHTFGPGGGPGKGTFDASTVKAIHDAPGMAIWLYPQPLDEAGRKLQAQGKVRILDRVFAVNIENPLFVPSVEKLKAGFEKNPGRPYFVLQGHPMQWDEQRWEQFVQIVEFLKSQGCAFMTPAEYVRTLVAEKQKP